MCCVYCVYASLCDLRVYVCVRVRVCVCVCVCVLVVYMYGVCELRGAISIDSSSITLYLIF